MNTIPSRRSSIYYKTAVSDKYTMYFHQAMKESDATQFLKTPHKEFVEFLSKGIFELITCSIVPEGGDLSPAVWSIKKNGG